MFAVRSNEAHLAIVKAFLRTHSPFSLQLHYVDAIPRNGMGKVLRDELRQRFSNGG